MNIVRIPFDKVEDLEVEAVKPKGIFGKSRKLKPIPKSTFTGEVFKPQSSKLLIVKGFFNRTVKSKQVFVSKLHLNGCRVQISPAEQLCKEQYLKGAVYAEIVELEKPIIEDRVNIFRDGQFMVYMVKVDSCEFQLTLINGSSSQNQQYSGSYSGCIDYCKNYIVKKNSELLIATKFFEEVKTIDPLTVLQRINNLPIPVQIIIMERLKAL